MSRLWVMGGLLAALTAGNFGCYLDELQAERRANGVLREDLERSKSDLADAEAMNRQKDTQIDGLSKELAAKDLALANANLEAKNLREAFENAQRILEEMAKKPGTGSVTIVREALPERLSSALEDFAKKYDKYVEFDPKTGTLRWKADLLFPLGSDTMSTNPELREAMKRFAEIVNSADAADFDVVIVGHTCNTPIRKAETLREHKTNWHLSAHRAISVMNLLGTFGVDSDRLGVMGYGEYRPIADNATPAGKEKNRRVEIYLVPKGSVQSMGGGIYKDSGGEFMKPSEAAGEKAPAGAAAEKKPAPRRRPAAGAEEEAPAPGPRE